MNLTMSISHISSKFLDILEFDGLLVDFDETFSEYLIWVSNSSTTISFFHLQVSWGFDGSGMYASLCCVPIPSCVPIVFDHFLHVFSTRPRDRKVKEKMNKMR